MADIAFIFHWPPDVMDRMSLEDLAAWWRRAIDRWNAAHDKGANG